MNILGIDEKKSETRFLTHHLADMLSDDRLASVQRNSWDVSPSVGPTRLCAILWR